MVGDVLGGDEVSYAFYQRREGSLPWRFNLLLMYRAVFVVSLLLNAALLATLAYLVAYDPVVATVTTPASKQRTVLAGVVNEELASRHGDEVLSDLVGRSLIDLAAEESHVKLDEAELESRWQSWLTEPGVQARIDSGETTERALRDRLMTLVLLDQLSWNDLTLKEQEKQMRAYYEANATDFEQLHLRHILVEGQKDAEDVSARLEAGVEFPELAKRFSLDPLTRDVGGDMGWKSRADLAEDLRAFLFQLPVGAASGPVSSPTGWHVFLVEERKDSYEDCKDQVRRELTKQRRPETLDALRQRFKVEQSEGEVLMRALKRPGYFQDQQSRSYSLDGEASRPSEPQTTRTPPPSSTATP